MSLLNDLQWRYAAKNMSGEKISAEKLNVVLDAIQLSASSYGLQPYAVLVVSNNDLKLKLQAASYNQPQVGNSSHILVFVVPEKLTAENIETHIKNVADTRGIGAEHLEGYKQMMLNTVGALPAEHQQAWAAKQAYIALGTALAVAAEQKIDTCPMEGFDAAQVSEILGLKEKSLIPIILLPIGIRAADDASANYKKVRKSKENLFTELA
jgi:nitroreductase